MYVPDDSALLSHARAYDPIKAREYYLRTRKLKGRKAGAEPVRSGRPRGKAAYSPVRANRSARQAELAAQREALEKRLDKLRSVLADLVKQAKVRSGVKNEAPDDTSDPKEAAAKNESNKKSSPLTESEKRKKAAKARAEYESVDNKDPSATKEIEQLQRKIADIRARIQRAIAESKGSSAAQPVKSNIQTASKGR